MKVCIEHNGNNFEVYYKNNGLIDKVKNSKTNEWETLKFVKKGADYTIKGERSAGEYIDNQCSGDYILVKSANLFLPNRIFIENPKL